MDGFLPCFHVKNSTPTLMKFGTYSNRTDLGLKHQFLTHNSVFFGDYRW